MKYKQTFNVFDGPLSLNRKLGTVTVTSNSPRSSGDSHVKDLAKLTYPDSRDVLTITVSATVEVR